MLILTFHRVLKQSLHLSVSLLPPFSPSPSSPRFLDVVSHFSGDSPTFLSGLQWGALGLKTRVTMASSQGWADSNSGPHTRSTNVLPSDSSLQHSAAPQWVPTHRDEITLGVFAATFNPGDTLVTVQHVARLAHAALLAGGEDFRTDVFAEAFWVQAGRQAGGKALGVLGVGRALESYEVEERLVERNKGGPVSQIVF